MKDFTELEIARFMSHVEKRESGCWEWVGALNEKGYGVLGIRGVTAKAHRISYQMFVREITREERLLHSCDNPPCCNPEHFSVGDRAANNLDMIQKGRKRSGGTKCGANGKWKKGLSHHAAKITPDVVRAIRASKEALSYSELAANYGLGVTTLWKIIHRKTWAHVN
jgi:hypothetical protein